MLADKLWVINSGDPPKREAALDVAAQTGIIAYDIMMIERYEITTMLRGNSSTTAGPSGRD